MPMPEPNYTDRELFERAGELLEAYLEAYAAERGRSLTDEEISHRRNGTTIAVTEVLVRGSYTYIVTANASEAWNVLNRNRRLLRPFEVLGDPSTNVYLRWTPEEKQEYFSLKGRKPPREFTTHAEQLGAWSGRTLGGSVLRIGVSRNICDVCREFFREFFRWARLIDPSTRFPPRTPTRSGTENVAPRPPSATTNTFSAEQRATAALVLVIQGANFIIERYVAHREAARVREAIRAKENYLEGYRNNNRSIGVLIWIYFDDALFVPPLEFSYGSTMREAMGSAQATVRPRSTDVSVAWLPPRDPPSFSHYQPPFSRVALATFNSGIVFQDVKYTKLFGFDDQGESVPPPQPPGFFARFWILETPTQISEYYDNRYNTANVDVTTRRLASGQPIQCFDLDPTWFSVGNDSVFMAFPADDATNELLFRRVRGIHDPMRQLRAYDLEFVRWVSPERARLLALPQ
jgi:hypothetical protein